MELPLSFHPVVVVLMEHDFLEYKRHIKHKKKYSVTTNKNIHNLIQVYILDSRKANILIVVSAYVCLMERNIADLLHFNLICLV